MFSRALGDVAGVFCVQFVPFHVHVSFSRPVFRVPPNINTSLRPSS
jgi:hypothetical protein